MDDQKQTPQEEEDSRVVLTDEEGNDVEFELLDCVVYQDTEYLVLLPVEDDADEVVILEVQPISEEDENYLTVEDEDVLDAVYGIFKERYKDILTFGD